jgi:hypothetical protein
LSIPYQVKNGWIMKKRNRCILSALSFVLGLAIFHASAITQQSWVQLSSSKGELPKPVETTTEGYLVTMLVLDVDKDGLKDVVIGSYTQMYWYKQGRSGDKITFTAKTLDLNIAASEDDATSIEAGGEFYDIDGDRDLDIVQGGHKNASVWWWENPYPEYAAGTNWT